MKETLQIREIAPYFPFSVYLYREGFPLVLINQLLLSKDYSYWKLVLRPISENELKSPIAKLDGIDCSLLDYISTSIKDSQLNARLLLSGKYDQLEFWKIQRLAEHHVDFQNLIGRGLAINVNDLNITSKCIFQASNDTTSATICIHCGKEKFEHI